MSEARKTLLFCLGAAALAAAAAVIDPAASTPSIFNDQGELFYPEFTDPQAPKAIEVIDYDDETATATPLKVEFKDNRWVIPSHHDYSADAEDRLAATAAALIEIKKDIVVSDRVEDHGEYGVIDPLDEDSASLSGRGKRVTLRDADEAVLADFIIGPAVPDKSGYRYMRVPGRRRVYAVKTDAEPSARFADWIETDLLKLSASDVRRVVVNNYAIRQQFGAPTIQRRENIVISQNDKGEWRVGSRKPNDEKIAALTKALAELRIIDVRPKPDVVTDDLKTKGRVTPSMAAARDLVERGFYLAGDGQIFGAEGEIIVDSKTGVRYTLRFGELAQGGPAAKEGEGEGENRFLFIAADYSEARAKQYAGESGTPDPKGKELGQELRERFAGWYYVISGAEFNHLRPTLAELLKS